MDAVDDGGGASATTRIASLVMMGKRLRVLSVPTSRSRAAGSGDRGVGADRESQDRGARGRARFEARPPNPRPPILLRSGVGQPEPAAILQAQQCYLRADVAAGGRVGDFSSRRRSESLAGAERESASSIIRSAARRIRTETRSRLALIASTQFILVLLHGRCASTSAAGIFETPGLPDDSFGRGE